MKYPAPPANQKIADMTNTATPELIRYLLNVQHYIKQLEKRIEALETGS